MIKNRPHRRVQLVECPLCGEDLRDTLPHAHIVRDHSPVDALSGTGLGEKI